MAGLASAPIPTSTFPAILQFKIQSRRCIMISITKLCSSDLSRTSFSFGDTRVIRRSSVISRSNTGPGALGSGDNEGRNVLDAFFLGKALAEALNERVESTIGEFLSVVGRLQAEQQKQVQDFQEEVFESAKRAKEKAAREALEAQGLIPKSTTGTTLVAHGAAHNGAASKVSPSTTNYSASANTSSYNPSAPAANTDPGPEFY